MRSIKVSQTFMDRFSFSDYVKRYYIISDPANVAEKIIDNNYSVAVYKQPDNRRPDIGTEYLFAIQAIWCLLSHKHVESFLMGAHGVWYFIASIKDLLIFA